MAKDKSNRSKVVRKRKKMRLTRRGRAIVESRQPVEKPVWMSDAEWISLLAMQNELAEQSLRGGDQ